MNINALLASVGEKRLFTQLKLLLHLERAAGDCGVGVFIVKKKIMLAVALLVCLLLCSGCSSKNDDSSPAKDRVIIYTAAEEERIAYLQTALNQKFPETKIVFQSLGTGQLLSKLQAEGQNTACDIFYDLDVVNAELILNAHPDLFADLSAFDFSIYDSSVLGYTQRHHKYAVNGKTYGAFLVNTKLLAEKSIPVPHTYQDMTKEVYASLISIPSPKSSGTGYSYYNGMLSLLGEEKGMEYFAALNPNIKEYTTSGSAPAKAAVRGDVAIAFGLLWQCVQCANENEGMQVIIPEQRLPFGLFTMGMISGHENNGSVKDIFTYLYTELNKQQCAKFNPDRIYVEMPAAEIANYPTGISEINMQNLFDFQYKQNMLDQWQY